MSRIIQARRASEGNRGDTFACASGFNARRFGAILTQVFTVTQFATNQDCFMNNPG